MPELPDVEIFGRYIKSRAIDQKIFDVTVNNPKILKGYPVQKFKDSLRGLSFTGITRHGKILFVHTSGNIYLVLHFGMTGRVRHSDDPVDSNKFDRVVFHFDNGESLAYSNMRMIGEVSITESIESFLQKRKIAPDALDFTFDMFKNALESHNSQIKVVLTNQGIIAGIGNVYSDEILYQSKVHPQTKTADIPDELKKTIFQKMKSVLPEAIDKDADEGKLPGTFLLPNRKSGKKCPACEGTVKKIYIAGRPTYFCPECQVK